RIERLSAFGWSLPGGDAAVLRVAARCRAAQEDPVGQLRSAVRDPDPGWLLDPAGYAGLSRGIALTAASLASPPVPAGGREVRCAGRVATTLKTAPSPERESRRGQRPAAPCCDVRLPSDARRYVSALTSG